MSHSSGRERVARTVILATLTGLTAVATGCNGNVAERTEGGGDATESSPESSETAAGVARVGFEGVGVRNSDHALDLRIRSGRRRRASDSKEAREASVRHSIGLPWLPNCRVRSRSVQDLSPSDSDLSQLGWRRGSHSGFREGDSRRSDRRPDRAKPQVTRVTGVF